MAIAFPHPFYLDARKTECNSYRQRLLRFIARVVDSLMQSVLKRYVLTLYS